MVFKVSKCAEEDKVTYAASMMKSEALFWWEIITNLRGEEAVARMSWDEFKVLFNEKLCPRTAVKQLEEEFLRLEQGSLTVREYTTSFTEKVRFSEHYVFTEERRVERFIWGLKASIREFVLTMKPTTFQEAVNAAEVREKEMVRQESERGQLKRKWEASNNEARRQKVGNSERKVCQEQSGKPCPKCNLVHRGECLVKPRVCYRCGKAGHLSQDCRMERRERLCYICKSPNHVQADCPQRKKDVTAIQGESIGGKGEERQQEAPRPKGRVFQMAAAEAEETPDVVTGTFSSISVVINPYMELT
ncbi:uncharacterized protein LOC112508683 [Cynara cardunculus var. scolymus]|uniref:uncharacterized protein LOC112508683 n=1 Tax=Cynara cardunculus var. scolymus TaxID=59895 RepID=UPI000D629445|nr:uncharacterized protein LOC112508683 [Cynara cardunculus var. scolymus]